MSMTIVSYSSCVILLLNPSYHALDAYHQSKGDNTISWPTEWQELHQDQYSLSDYYEEMP
jgi:hypothetical protein